MNATTATHPIAAEAEPTRVALTSDIGEGFGRWSLGEDDALLEIITSANVACGFHGGDPGIMRRTCAIAVANGVSIGAQVSYRDLHGFGRRYIAMPGPELRDDLLYQMGALEVFARLAGGQVDYVRAHGALYNATAKDAEHAQALVDATVEFNKNLPLLCQAGTETWRRGQDAGLRVVSEAFVDRAYTAEGLLQPRTQPHALLQNADEAADRAVHMATDGVITANDGSRIEVRAEALLVHCDTPGAVEIARRTRAALEAAGIELRPVR
ncbi:LamB/YcsF family protein [Pseudonocardia sp. CA-107938]|uniref:LamB/YcsF family protein n=1 Tax=Pseudonocardia sp. CA-107938 TaxID=3240021 RepID=UPI003D89DBCB